jgi:hypothetical protein
MQVVKVDVQQNDRDYGRWLCERLEAGDILTIEQTPYAPTDDDSAFLRSQNQAQGSLHKNIAYKPNKSQVTGAQSTDQGDVERVKRILVNYSESALEYLKKLFPDYASSWKVDYATFRPVEEQGRDLPLSHRNDLMHVDAFPTRPTHGGRILRAFTNIHPERDRVWATSWSFEELVRRYADDAGVRDVTGAMASAKRLGGRIVRLTGLRVPDRSPYDEFMLRFHHYLKANAEFQKTGKVDASAFTPRTTWISFTDHIAHAVLSGQYAVEQTCIVPFSAMLKPEIAPLKVLERHVGRPLVDPREMPRNAA